jgi:hypothetical protein
MKKGRVKYQSLRRQNNQLRSGVKQIKSPRLLQAFPRRSITAIKLRVKSNCCRVDKRSALVPFRVSTYTEIVMVDALRLSTLRFSLNLMSVTPKRRNYTKCLLNGAIAIVITPRPAQKIDAEPAAASDIEHRIIYSTRS